MIICDDSLEYCVSVDAVEETPIYKISEDPIFANLFSPIFLKSHSVIILYTFAAVEETTPSDWVSVEVPGAGGKE